MTKLFTVNCLPFAVQYPFAFRHDEWFMVNVWKKVTGEWRMEATGGSIR